MRRGLLSLRIHESVDSDLAQIRREHTLPARHDDIQQGCGDDGYACQRMGSSQTDTGCDCRGYCVNRERCHVTRISKPLRLEPLGEQAGARGKSGGHGWAGGRAGAVHTRTCPPDFPRAPACSPGGSRRSGLDLDVTWHLSRFP